MPDAIRSPKPLSAPRISLALRWPATLPEASLAERALTAELVGEAPVMPSRSALTRSVVQSLSALERGALRDEVESPGAARTFRDSAICRWRFKAALETVPQSMDEVDERPSTG